MSSDKRRALDALLRTDFEAFLEKVFITLTPGQPFIPNWHIGALAYQLERIRKGEINRLITNMPPRSMKSIAASVALPAFLLGHDPTLRIICVSYSAELAKKHSNDFRAIVESDWYRRIFPSTRIGGSKNTETEIEFTARGFRYATSVGGTLTGRGGDIIIIDDPLKPEDAMSESRRTGANNWFTNTLLSRLDDKQNGAIVVVMQRLHVDDLTGFLLDQSDDWELLTLPAIALCDEVVSLGGGKRHRRKPGEVLWPAREPLKTLEALKLQMGSQSFSAQYQQAPEPPGGAMIKRHWIKRYTELPPRSEWACTVQSWDAASKGGPENDFSVCPTWLIARGQRWYLLHVYRGRIDYPTLKAKAVALAREQKANCVLVEDAGAGTALVQELRSQISGIIGVKPQSDKVTRMSVVSAKFEAGQVFFPERAGWLPDLEAELFSFPASRHDDQCDSISQALNDANLPWMSLLTRSEWERILRWAATPDYRSPYHSRW